MFRFKQFAVDDDRCAMKVGTDGVLLGAWAEIPAQAAGRVLDVGAGCGLISLMLAQRFPVAEITALEIDPEAAGQAWENVQNSPFARQINVETKDFLCFAAERPFDAVVSNPPFFEEDLLPPDSARAHARHTATGLNFESLVAHSAALLSDGGWLQVIIPKTSQTRFHGLCNAHGLTLVRATDVRTVQRKEPKRVLLHFVKDGVCESSGTVVRDELILMTDGQRSEQYTALCRDFYL